MFINLFSLKSLLLRENGSMLLLAALISFSLRLALVYLISFFGLLTLVLNYLIWPYLVYNCSAEDSPKWLLMMPSIGVCGRLARP